MAQRLPFVVALPDAPAPFSPGVAPRLAPRNPFHRCCSFLLGSLRAYNPAVSPSCSNRSWGPQSAATVEALVRAAAHLAWLAPGLRIEPTEDGLLLELGLSRGFAIAVARVSLSPACFFHTGFLSVALPMTYPVSCLNRASDSVAI